MERQQPVFPGARYLRQQIRVPPDVIDVERDAECARPLRIQPEIARAGKDRLLAFHVCDWLVPTKDILNDRGMMGDGVIDILSVRAAVEAQGYAGYCEIEMFSADWWNRPMDEGFKTCIHRHRSVGYPKSIR